MVRLSPRSFRVVADHERRPTPSSAPLAGDHVGMVLREARESAAYALSDIAYTLRIRYLFLQAIEEGRFADLPGTTYAVGFVRSYADYLGLDSTAVVARFKAETADARGETSLAFPETPPERRFFPSAAVIMVSLLAVGGALGGWFYIQDEQDVIAQRIAEPPALPAFDRELARAETRIAATQTPAPKPTIDALGLAAADAAVVAAAPEIDIETAAGGRREQAAIAGIPRPPPAPAVPPPAEAAQSAPAVSDTVAETIIPDTVVPLPTKLAQILPAIPQSTAPAQPSSPAQSTISVQPVAPVQSTASAQPTAIPRPPGNSGAAIAAEAPPQAPPQVASTGGQAGRLVIPAVPPGAVPTTLGRVYGGANRNARIIILATADSWVQIRDGAQNVLLTRMLRTGDSYRVPDKQDLWLLTGNAGGLEISVDGRPITTLGPSGKVLRDVPLDVTALKAR